MGRAAPDLPDPLENQESAATGGADDLLSQLAGDEIDRLLAEADVEAAPPAPTDAAATVAADPGGAPVSALAGAVLSEAVPSAPPEPSLDSQLNDLFNALNEPSAPAPADGPTAGEEALSEAVTETATAAAPVAPVALDLDDQLAKLANELLPAPAAEQALVAGDVPAASVPASETSQQDAPVADERAALLAESTEPADDHEEEAGEEMDAPVPWYVRPLIWLNAPFGSLSDGARDLIGKVALATLLFSITVLTFLAVTRHKL